jgi:hypothetical protein
MVDRRPELVLPAAPAVTPADPNGLLEPPADLVAADAEIWRRLAPLALAERTLTLSKAPGFRALCRRWAYCAALDARIREVGIATHEATALLMRLEKWEQLLNASVGDFSLRSFGKPATSEKPKKAINPFAQVAG